jgi:aspartate racemase
MQKKTLGIMGGMGPAAGAKFFSLITYFTKAKSDGEHIKTILYSNTDIPDRTDFILGKKNISPSGQMKRSLAVLCGAGAQVIAIPCNTADAFYNEMKSFTDIPILRAAHSCAEYAAKKGVGRLGILATSGAIRARVYQTALDELGVDYALPKPESQARLDGLIYGSLKSSLTADKEVLYAAAEELMMCGCDAVAMGCTELSLIEIDEEDERCNLIDSLKVLAAASIRACGYELNERGIAYE